MLRVQLSHLPFVVCLGWFIVFALRYQKCDAAKRVLMLYLGVCTVLYYCHAHYFTDGLSRPMESLWALCSLSTYPIYYIYILTLTSRTKPGYLCLLMFVPSLLIALAKLLYPYQATDVVRQVLFTLQIFAVCYYGIKRLKAFDTELARLYADTEERDTTAVKQLLMAVMAISVCAAIANTLGRHFFAQSDWLVFFLALAFSATQFLLSYIGYRRKFTVEQLCADISETDALLPETIEPDEFVTQHNAEIATKLEQLMLGQQFFLTPNLKISDVSRKIGICRTYISNYINQTYAVSFSDYVNQMRVEHAKRLLLDTAHYKMIEIAERSGFTSEQSFYRNFKKQTGMKPSEWQSEQKHNTGAQ